MRWAARKSQIPSVQDSSHWLHWPRLARPYLRQTSPLAAPCSYSFRPCPCRAFDPSDLLMDSLRASAYSFPSSVAEKLVDLGMLTAFSYRACSSPSSAAMLMATDLSAACSFPACSFAGVKVLASVTSELPAFLFLSS